MSNRNSRTFSMIISALLIAIGIIIPMFFPKIVLEPASFTLASHVPVFIAMFISPSVTLAVALGSTVGFLFSGLPIVVVLRALTHVIFAIIGAVWLKRHPQTFDSMPKLFLLGFIVSVIHAAGEMAVVIPFYFGQAMSSAYYQKGFIVAVVLLTGVGTVIHSMVDFAISVVIYKPLKRYLKK